MGGWREGQDCGNETQANEPMRNYFPGDRCHRHSTEKKGQGGTMRFYIELSGTVNGSQRIAFASAPSNPVGRPAASPCPPSGNADDQRWKATSRNGDISAPLPWRLIAERVVLSQRRAWAGRFRAAGQRDWGWRGRRGV